MNSFDLTKLGPEAFEHLVDHLALCVLGAGHSTFGPGPDGGRDGLFEGAAPYPSDKESWSGVWYLQSKYHAPHLSADPQKWLLNQIERELQIFADPGSRRRWPDIWIIASNIDPSGNASTGAFDRAKALVKAKRPKLAPKFQIWGGKKILDLLTLHPDIAGRYRHFLTPGNVIASLLEQMTDAKASADRILRYFIVTTFEEHIHTKLEQAGSGTDSRPGIHKLFRDVPFIDSDARTGMAMEYLLKAASTSHERVGVVQTDQKWSTWMRSPERAKTWFLRGGPGRGKSTIGQYFAQIQRALLIQHEPPRISRRPLRLSQAVAA